MGKKDKFAEKKKAKEEAEANALAEKLAAEAALAPPPPAPVKAAAKQVSRVGSKGTPTEVEVNFFSMDISKLIKEAFHYDLEFDPPGPKKFISKALELFRTEHFKDAVFAFDGRKNVYTDKRLKINGEALEDKVELPVEEGRVKTYKIKIKLAATIDMSVLKDYKNKADDDVNVTTALNCIDIVLRCRFKNTDALPFGKQFYYPHERKPLGDGLELWRGLYQSAVLGTKSLYLNADVINKAVAVDMEVLEFIADMNRGQMPRSLQPYQAEKVTQHLKELRVEYKAKKNDSPRLKVFYKLVKSAADQKFRLEGKEVSVEQYFRTKFGVKLQYPQLPLIQVLPADKNIYLPMECCRIAGGQLNQKKCDLQKMILETAKPSHERKQMIATLSSFFKVNDDIKKFGIGISEQFEKVMARILNAPGIVYKNPGKGNKVETPNPRNGTWKTDCGFMLASPIAAKYAIINCDNVSLQILAQLKKSINAGGAKNNLKLEDSGSENIFNGRKFQRDDEMKKFLEQNLQTCKAKGFNLVFVIVSDNICYAVAKTIAETTVGILTQCLKPKSFYNARNQEYSMPPSTLDNIFLKVNSKLNGVNHQINEPSYNTTVMSKEHFVMFIGADVTHPSPEQRGTCPSVAAVCASTDRSGFRYNPIWRLQKPGSDLIADFEEIMVEQFQVFKAKNGDKLPSKIFYYRDGVGESQFDKFIGPETDSLRRACTRMYGQNKHPEINLIVVNKRHHMRAFPISPSSGDGTKFNNILPGTVVDKDIVSCKYFQFYLASHSAIQGCTKPTKYTVLLNESNINADDLQALTNCLCYMYVRCNRVVSYPNCTYYAHWMASRAKCYIGGAALNLENLDHEYKTRALNKTVVNAHPMFFV